MQRTELSCMHPKHVALLCYAGYLTTYINPCYGLGQVIKTDSRSFLAANEITYLLVVIKNTRATASY